jgi:acyl-CoA reductase-like NAD-dependent aldehyde dehydrogenase
MTRPMAKPQVKAVQLSLSSLSGSVARRRALTRQFLVDVDAADGLLLGPAAVIYRITSADEAIELANDSPFGLSDAIFAKDEALALAVADKLEAGMVWINEPGGGGPDLPFGGTKRSGLGRELGPHGIAEFVNKKLIHTPANAQRQHLPGS